VGARPENFWKFSKRQKQDGFRLPDNIVQAVKFAGEKYGKVRA